jgi:hypothetical protein
VINREISKFKCHTKEREEKQIGLSFYSSARTAEASSTSDMRIYKHTTCKRGQGRDAKVDKKKERKRKKARIKKILLVINCLPSPVCQLLLGQSRW